MTHSYILSSRHSDKAMDIGGSDRETGAQPQKGEGLGSPVTYRYYPYPFMSYQANKEKCSVYAPKKRTISAHVRRGVPTNPITPSKDPAVISKFEDCRIALLGWHETDFLNFSRLLSCRR